MKKLILFLTLFLASCSNELPSSPQPAVWQFPSRTPDPFAVKRQAEELQLTADTAEIHRATAMGALLSAYSTQTAIAGATYEARQARFAAQTQDSASATNQAAADTTQRAWMIVGWTATAVSDKTTSTAMAALSIDSATQRAAATKAVLELEAAHRIATIEAAQVESALLALDRTRYVNLFYAFTQAALPPTLTLLAAVLFIWVVKRLFRYRQLNPDERGKLPVLVDNNKVLNPNRLIEPIDDLTNPRRADPRTQAQITALDLAVDLNRASSSKNAGRRELNQGLSSLSQPDPSHSDPEAPEMPDSAPWNLHLLYSHRGKALPLGIDQAGGVITVNLENLAPSMLFAGTTGSGKTRYGIRPLITAALIHGHQIVILDRSGVDFQPFQDHPNCLLIKLDEPEDVIKHLQNIGSEILRRENEMAANGVSLWSRQSPSGGRCFIILDEFSTLGDEMSPTNKIELWRWARLIAARGRKAGIHLIMAVQNPTRSSIDPGIRRNCTLVVFKVQDSAASLAVLSSIGAETLDTRQFIATLMGGLQRGIAFDPSDLEIQHTLESFKASVLPAPAFLLSDNSDNSDDSDNRNNRIIDLYLEGKSLTQICKTVFGYTGGQAFVTAKLVIEEFERTTTSDTTPEASNIGAVGS